MNIPKIEEAITLLYQTFIEDQDVATQRGIAITAMNEMVRLLGGVDVVEKIESVPYSARLRTQHLFEDEPPQRTEQEPQIAFNAEVVGYIAPQRTWVGLTKDEVDSWNLPDHPTVFEFAQFIESKLKEKNI